MASEQDQDFLDFLDTYSEGGASAGTSAPSTDAPAPSTDAPSTEEPAAETAAPSTDAPSTDEPAAETAAPSTDAPAADEDDIPMPEDVEAAYRNLVKELTGRSTPAETEPAKGTEPAPTAQQQPAAPAADAKTKEVNYLEGEDFDEITESPEALNKLLNKVARSVRDEAAAADERMATRMPETLLKFVQYQSTLQREAEEFYNKNSDLQHVKPYVSQIANAIGQEHPEWTVRQVFDETANRARQVLGLQAQAQRSGARKVNTPTPSGKAPARKPAKPKLNAMEQDILDIIAGGE